MNPNLHLKYRTDSMRAFWWDYNSPASYFITICVKQKACVFGEIDQKRMLPNHSGSIATEIWHLIPKQFERTRLGAFILMPNHIHGIIHILDKFDQTERLPEQGNGGFAGDKNPMFYENLGRIIRWYKGRTTFEIHKQMNDFCWQRNYFDIIVQNEPSLRLMEDYINTNPLRWKA